MIRQYPRFSQRISNSTSSGGYTMDQAEASAPILSQTVHFNLIEQYFTEPSSSHMSRATWTTIL